jgi:hypothetical protein
MGSQATLEEIAESIDRSTLDEPSDRLRNYLASLPPARKVSDRRRSERYSVIADVVVVPLDKGFRPAGPPFIACSLNVSAGGMCLYHSEQVDATLLYVEIASPDAPGMSARMQVLRQRRVCGYFEIAGQFLLDNPPKDAPPNDPRRLAPEPKRRRGRS